MARFVLGAWLDERVSLSFDGIGVRISARGVFEIPISNQNYQMLCNTFDKLSKSY